MGMNLKKCSNGHFYDEDTYASCPHCGGTNAEPNQTFSFADNGGAEAGKTMGWDISQPSMESVADVIPPVEEMDYHQESKTISIYQNIKVETPQKSPTVGWLVCLKGKFYGQDFRLKSGRNFIGRGANMDVCLAGENTVSRDRHATIIHEPRQNIFMAQPGESRELFYVNGEVVLSSVQLKKNDVLQMGDVQLMLIPCCDSAFNWNQED